MFMQMRILCDKLKYNKVQRSLIENKNLNIRAAKLLKPYQTHFEEDIVYIGKVSELPKELECVENVNIICIEDTTLPQNIVHNHSINLILVNDGSAIQDLFNEVQDILLDSYYFVQSSASLLNSIIRGKGLQYIIEIGSELLGNPVMLGDSNHRLLAYSKCDDVLDKAWTELRDIGYCTYEYTVKFDFKRWIENAVNSQTPVIGDLGEISKVRRIFAKVVIEDTIVGHLAVLEQNKPFSEKDLEITSFLCDVIASEMQKNNDYSNSRKLMLEMLMVELLEGNMKNEDVVQARLKYLKWSPKEKLYVLAVKYNRYEDTYGLISYMRDALHDLLEQKEAIFYENHILFLIGCDKNKYLKREDFHDFIQFMENNKLCAGISQEFNKIIKLKKYYEQAIIGISLGKKLGKDDIFFMYEHYAIHHIIDICCKQQDITDFCHPALLKLLAYDERHKTNYVKSLYVYLINMRNLASTADALYIHRNTMSYRIGKIHEIIGLELDNDDLSMNLFVSFKLLEYSGKI